jgi:uncharacterized protein YdeI (BOF family)
MVSWGSELNAQTTPSATPDRQAQQPSSTPNTAPTPSPEMPPSSQQTPNAQTPPAQTPDTTAPESGSKAGTSPAAGAGENSTQTFSGTVVKQGDKYVLKDDSGKIYDIDHQSDVAKFDGKRVRVQGTLDPSGKIMVK